MGTVTVLRSPGQLERSKILKSCLSLRNSDHEGISLVLRIQDNQPMTDSDMTSLRKYGLLEADGTLKTAARAVLLAGLF